MESVAVARYRCAYTYSPKSNDSMVSSVWFEPIEGFVVNNKSIPEVIAKKPDDVVYNAPIMLPYQGIVPENHPLYNTSKVYWFTELYKAHDLNYFEEHFPEFKLFINGDDVLREWSNKFPNRRRLRCKKK